MANQVNKKGNYEVLAELLERYGDLRSVHRVDNGFFISDLYLNGDGELRLDCTDMITSRDLAEEALSNRAGTNNIHHLFKSRSEIIKDKIRALEAIEEDIDTYIYEQIDNSFMEHADYVLENIDFSKLTTQDYHRGVIEFLEANKESNINEFHFISECSHH